MKMLEQLASFLARLGSTWQRLKTRADISPYNTSFHLSLSCLPALQSGGTVQSKRIPQQANMKQVRASFQGNILISSVHAGVPCLLEEQHPFISVSKTALKAS